MTRRPPDSPPLPARRELDAPGGADEDQVVVSVENSCVATPEEARDRLRAVIELLRRKAGLAPRAAGP